MQDEQGITHCHAHCVISPTAVSLDWPTADWPQMARRCVPYVGPGSF